MHWLIPTTGLVFLASVVILCILIWYRDAIPFRYLYGPFARNSEKRRQAYLTVAGFPIAVVVAASLTALVFMVFEPFLDKSDPSVTWEVELIGFILMLVYGGFGLLVVLALMTIVGNISRYRHSQLT